MHPTLPEPSSMCDTNPSKNIPLFYEKEELLVYCVICDRHVSSDSTQLLPKNLFGLRTVLDQLLLSDLDRSASFLRAMKHQQYTACKSHMQFRPAFLGDYKPRRKRTSTNPVSTAASRKVLKPVVVAPNGNSTSERVRAQLREAVAQRTTHNHTVSTPLSFSSTVPSTPVSSSPSPHFFFSSPSSYRRFSTSSSSTTVDSPSLPILPSPKRGEDKVEPEPLIKFEVTDSSLDDPFDELMSLPINNQFGSVPSDSGTEQISSSVTVPFLWDNEFMESSLPFPAFFPAQHDLNPFYDYSMDENNLFHV